MLEVCSAAAAAVLVRSVDIRFDAVLRYCKLSAPEYTAPTNLWCCVQSVNVANVMQVSCIL